MVDLIFFGIIISLRNIPYMKNLIFDISPLAYRWLFSDLNDVKMLGMNILRSKLLRNLIFTVEKFNPDKVYICFDCQGSNWSDSMLAGCTSKSQRYPKSRITQVRSSFLKHSPTRHNPRQKVSSTSAPRNCNGRTFTAHRRSVGASGRIPSERYTLDLTAAHASNKHWEHGQCNMTLPGFGIGVSTIPTT